VGKEQKPSKTRIGLIRNADEQDKKEIALITA
jgi:hypothetical protein